MGNAVGGLEGGHALQGHISMSSECFQGTISGQGTSSHCVHTRNDKAL